ncbi:MAG: phage holin family protein [Thiobacillaceae bacterium]|jgi:uncharacterized membrane protein YqjE
MSDQPGGEGVFASLKNLAATLVATGRTRLELLGNEIALEKQRALRLLLLTQALIFCLGLGLLLVVTLIALLMWDQRIAVVTVFAVLFLGLAGLLFAAVRRALHPPEPVFAASLAELQEDLRQLKAASGHAKETD